VATTILTVPCLSCEHCERTIKEALTPVDGVNTVAVDIPAKQVRVDYDAGAVSVDQMKSILAEEDYPVEATASA